jgi:hypothetical protein
VYAPLLGFRFARSFSANGRLRKNSHAETIRWIGVRGIEQSLVCLPMKRSRKRVSNRKQDDPEQREGERNYALGKSDGGRRWCGIGIWVSVAHNDLNCEDCADRDSPRGLYEIRVGFLSCLSSVYECNLMSIDIGQRCFLLCQLGEIYAIYLTQVEARKFSWKRT